VLLRSLEQQTETIPLTVSVKVKSNLNEFYKGLFLDSTFEFAMKNQYGTVLEENNAATSLREQIEKYLKKSPGLLCISFHWLPASIPETPVVEGKNVYYLLTRNSIPLLKMLPKTVITSLDTFTNFLPKKPKATLVNNFEDKKREFFSVKSGKTQLKRGRPKKDSESEKRNSEGKREKRKSEKRKSEKRNSEGKKKKKQ